MQHTLHRMKLLIRWSLWGRRSKTISPTAKQLYSPMKTLSSNPWVKGKPLLPSCSDCAKLTPVKTPAIEVHWRGTSHGTGTLSNPHLEPQFSCQQPRSRTPETFLCHRNQYLHHTCLIFSHPNIPFPSRPATITLEWVLRAFPNIHTGWNSVGGLLLLI